GLTGFIYPCGHVEQLSHLISQALSDPARLNAMGAAARQKMRSCSPQTNTCDLIRLLGRIFRVRRASSSAAGGGSMKWLRFNAPERMGRILSSPRYAARMAFREATWAGERFVARITYESPW